VYLLYTGEVIHTYLQQLVLPDSASHKGENGKVLIVGGSDLFHAASQWAFQVASRLVDMTFYSSVAENNTLIQETKSWIGNGVVVPRKDLPHYLSEVNSVLIGPGLRRDFRSRFTVAQLSELRWQDLTELDWEFDTLAMVSVLLRSFPDKRWVIDAGALQVLQPTWLPPRAILTPHQKEFSDLVGKLAGKNGATVTDQLQEVMTTIGVHLYGKEKSTEPVVISEKSLLKVLPVALKQELQRIAGELNQATLIVKGQVDLIWNSAEMVAVGGGNAGLTKGGTGDALAGLVAGFVACSPNLASVVVSSYVNKLAGHELYLQRELMYNTTDLVEQIPLSWRKLIS
jgi:NAD(P)H-hydrate repair Nnr-like enzyme with NAD(P)H-hydrate dehydratase domain